ncbi:hypothetical protein DFQ28_002573 [Apophysomyces sp. BC1034]|nr:hypothetical protein DFQ30_004379 [Apophysomyces sp. BC1015]KAG0181752.1 hypothetical protein DFQ29_007183 [Apophysomyces sp. BC1021]KAG0193925.1 hypothetical protein DFQ28_002573 [Apophysomyces sp. BC1034]
MTHGQTLARQQIRTRPLAQDAYNEWTEILQDTIRDDLVDGNPEELEQDYMAQAVGIVGDDSDYYFNPPDFQYDYYDKAAKDNSEHHHHHHHHNSDTHEHHHHSTTHHHHHSTTSSAFFYHYSTGTEGGHHYASTPTGKPHAITPIRTTPAKVALSTHNGISTISNNNLISSYSAPSSIMVLAPPQETPAMPSIFVSTVYAYDNRPAAYPNIDFNTYEQDLGGLGQIGIFTNGAPRFRTDSPALSAPLVVMLFAFLSLSRF